MAYQESKYRFQAAIVAQISITALSLDYLSQTHWIARGFLVFSIISSLIAVYYATTQQRTMGRLLQPTQVRGWIRGQLPPRSDPKDYQPAQSPSTSISDDFMRACFTPSVASVMTMSAPKILLSTSLLTLILGMGVYFGFIWTRDLDIDAQPGDSRNVMVMYLVSIVTCFMVYLLSGLIQDSDPTTEKRILLEYMKDYVDTHTDATVQWTGGFGQ
jgi:hypothetical protein